MDIRNLTPEQKALILKMGKNGFDVEEMKELSKLGLYNKSVAEALYSELAGEAQEVGDSSPFAQNDEMPKEKGFIEGIMDQLWPGKPWAERTGLGKFVRTIMTISGSPVFALGALTGCEKLIEDYPPTSSLKAEIESNSKVSIEVYINNDLDELLSMVSGLNELKALLEELVNGQNLTNDELANIKEKLNDIDVRLKALQTSFEDLKTQYGDKLDQIVKVLQEQNTSIADIVALLKQNEVDNKAILEALGQLLENDSEASKKLDEIIELMNNGLVLNKETQDAVYKIIAMLGDIQLGNGGGEVTVDLTKVEKMLEAILDAVTKLPNNNSDNENLNKAIQNLTDLVEKFMKQEFAMGEKTQELIEALIADFAKFAENEAEMDKGEQELARKILNAINNLSITGGGGDVTVDVDLSKLEEMLEILVNKVGNLEGGVEKLISLALDGNTALKDLMDVVKALKSDTNANFADVKKLLEAIKTGVDQNGNTLLSIEEKMDIIKLTLNEIKDSIPNLSDKIIAKLDEILAKIPNGCDCNIDEVLIKLENIITILQENPSNEGIVDDLDDLLQ